MSLFLGLSAGSTGVGISSADPEQCAIRSGDLHPLVATRPPADPDVEAARRQPTRVGNGIRNCVGNGSRKQAPWDSAIARVPQPLEADAAVGTKSGARSLWPAMGLITGLFCKSAQEQRGELRCNF